MADPHGAIPHNLSAPLTSFIGREREIEEVSHLLTGTRLLTLAGAGGCGKSRLALQVAAGLLRDYPDGVWAVELAALSEPTLVPQVVASTLDIPEQPRRPLIEVLVDSLRHRSLLLLLDNCEHLLAACASFADTVLRACPDLRILATSREPLGVFGETIWRVPSLSLPDILRLPPHDRLTRYEAIHLFVERASSIWPGFRLTASNAQAVTQVCQRLDGIPLAIELAAARVKALTVEQIAARLDDRFGLLTAGSRTALPRHRTLRGAMDWSYDLLSEKERGVLRRLSVFAGGWTLEAAEAVCSGEGVEASEILDTLIRLVDKSLVVAEPHGGNARYRLLETVRQYARDRLLESEDAGALRRRHRDWYLALAERADPELRGPAQVVWRDRLETEHDNLRAALAWSKAEEGGGEAGLRLAGALCWFWSARGYATDWREWLEDMLSVGSGAPAPVRAKALCAAGILAEWSDEYERAGQFLHESLALFQQLGDNWGAGVALHHLAHVVQTHGELSLAAAMFEDSLTCFRDAGDRWGRAFSLGCLAGIISGQGEYDRAALLFEESVALFREVGDQWHLAEPMSGLGLVAAAQGDFERATALLDESVKVARATGYKAGIAISLVRLGRVVLQRGDHGRAAALFNESLALRKELGDRWGIALCLTVLGGVAVAQGQLRRAAQLFGAAEALREAIQVPVSVSSIYRADYDRHLTVLRAGLDEAVLAAAWATGRAMTWEEAIAYALAPEGPPPSPEAQITVLTQREREVAALIAQGLTNRAIATRLVIAERTAEGHVQSVLNKLGFNSRSQIAAWAVAHGVHTVSPGEARRP